MFATRGTCCFIYIMHCQRGIARLTYELWNLLSSWKCCHAQYTLETKSNSTRVGLCWWLTKLNVSYWTLSLESQMYICRWKVERTFIHCTFDKVKRTFSGVARNLHLGAWNLGLGQWRSQKLCVGAGPRVSPFPLLPFLPLPTPLLPSPSLEVGPLKSS